MTKKRLFLISFLLTTSAVLLLSYLDYRRRYKIPDLKRLTDEVFVASQLQPSTLRALNYQGFKTIVDFRPDGESADQTPSSVMERFAKNNGFGFHYIPVPHESIPDDAVDKLKEVLAHDTKPAVLYCRSGRRAARTFALAVASQADGPNIDSILEMVRTAGFSAEDLKTNIAERISHRSSPPTTKN